MTAQMLGSRIMKNIELHCYGCDAGTDVTDTQKALEKGWTGVNHYEGDEHYIGWCPKCTSMDPLVLADQRQRQQRQAESVRIYKELGAPHLVIGARSYWHVDHKDDKHGRHVIIWDKSRSRVFDFNECTIIWDAEAIEECLTKPAVDLGERRVQKKTT